MEFSDLKRNLDRDFSSFPARRLALLGDSATQFLARAIKGYGYEERIHFQIFDADFDQINRQISDADSELYRSGAEFVVLYSCAERLWERFVATPPQTRIHFADQVLSEMQGWWKQVSKLSSAKIIQFNLLEMNDGVFGHFASKMQPSFHYQIRKINFQLMNFAQSEKQVFVADVAGLANQIGYVRAHDPRLYATARVAFALDFLPVVAKAVIDIVKAVSGNIKKCLILDLDNTVWGGIIGDDGLEKIQIGELGMGHAYDALQKWAKELKNRGVILAVCSKNDEVNAKKPFLEHPDMVLRLEDIAVFVANWENKVENIKRIQQTLNIGLDSMVFIDDSPFERNMVREFLPAVAVPEMPQDPSLYVACLRSLNLFETASFSEEDLNRTRQYQQEGARKDFEKSFVSIDDYLDNLQMISAVDKFNRFTIPRVAQLTQRSNQFNLRTVRYSESDVERMSQSSEFATLAFELKDQFGDYGLIAVVILKLLNPGVAFIDTWIMSCRVLKRGMEEFTVNRMVKCARELGVRQLVGEYIPTAKNGMVKDLYAHMGFISSNGKWDLEVDQFCEMKTPIRER